MSKARIMGAGSSGYNYGVNKNSPGNGNGKWQGLWPSVGHARNARLINTRAGGDNRNVVFCINQLGGVGKISTMFATTADGITDCKPTDNCKLSENVKNAISILNAYARQRSVQFCLKGVNETILQDTGVHDKFIPLYPNDVNLPNSIREAVLVINNLRIISPVKGVNQLHVAALVEWKDAAILRKAGFGRRVLCGRVIAYGDGFACNCNPGQSYGCEPHCEQWTYDNCGASLDRGSCVPQCNQVAGADASGTCPGSWLDPSWYVCQSAYGLCISGCNVCLGSQTACNVQCQGSCFTECNWRTLLPGVIIAVLTVGAGAAGYAAWVGVAEALADAELVATEAAELAAIEAEAAAGTSSAAMAEAVAAEAAADLEAIQALNGPVGALTQELPAFSAKFEAIGGFDALIAGDIDSTAMANAIAESATTVEEITDALQSAIAMSEEELAAIEANPWATEEELDALVNNYERGIEVLQKMKDAVVTAAESA